MKKIYSILAIIVLSFNLAFALEGETSVTVLPSGQKVVIKEIHDNEIVKIDTWINTGSINEDDKTSGISHFLEHLFFKGTQKYPTGTFDKILDSKGAIVNAATSKDYTHYYIQIPSADFDTALELHADMLINPMIPRKELERERPVVIEEISKTKDSPENRIFDNIYKLIYSKSNHPYQRNVIGTKEIIQNVTREEILNYYNRFYTPDAFTTVIVGDIDKDEAIKKVEKEFSNSKKNKQEIIKYPKIKPLTKIEKTIDKMDINKTYLMLGFLAPKFSDEKDTYALDVLSTILTNGKSSILNQRLKEEKNIVLSISSGNYSQKDSGLFYIYATLNPKEEENVEKEIIKEIEKIQKGELDEAILKKAKNLIKTDEYYSRESISNIADDLGYSFTFSNNENYYDNYIKNIEKISKKDVINATKKYLNTQKYAISIVSPKDYNQNIKKVSNEISEKNSAKLIEEKNNVKKYKLDNNATLITKKKKTNSIVAIDISIKGSKILENKPTSSLIAALGATYGTENYTRGQLAELLDESGIKLSLSSSNDIFSISVQTTKENLDKSLEILDEVINRATFPDNEIDKLKNRKIQELKTISDKPSSYIFDEFKKQAFQGSIYGQNSAFIIKSLENLTRDDVAKFYSKIINPLNTTISIVGDVDDEFLIEKFNKIIKTKNTDTKFSYSNANYKQFRPTKNIENTIYKKELQGNWIALGYKTCSMLSKENRKDLAVLNVIDSLLGDGMSSRLFMHLREEQSLAYIVGSTLSSNILDGAYIIYISTNSKNIEQAKKGILNEINTIKKEMVTSKELESAKSKILGQLLMSLETNMAEADLYGWYDILGRDLSAYEEYKQTIKNINQSDVIEVANKYFSKPYIYTVLKEKK